MDKYFEKFQIEEYKNISNAHFETNKQIGIFFRYFLIISSTPALIFAWFGKNNPKFIDSLLYGDYVSINLFVGFFLIFISIIGILSSFYLVSLRLDSILYARTVNGTRKYFYKLASLENEVSFRLLPKQTNIPKYFDNHTFGVLFYAVAIINSSYFALGTRIIASVGETFFKVYFHINPFIKNYNIFWTIGIFLTFFALHIVYYSYLSKYRIINYMKSRIIGIDIDGVLNKHRNTFCKIHFDNLHQIYGDNIPANKKLTPKEIKKIPVSRIKGKKIDRNDEFDVFNNPKYWEEQEIIDENVGSIISELKNVYGFKIIIHSYRPWPEYHYGKILKRENINQLWGIKEIKLFKKNFIIFRKKKLVKITKKWLKKNNIPVSKKWFGIKKRIYIEKTGIDSSKRSFTIWGLFLNISVGNFKNRFYYTLKRPYRYFIEDDIDNAIKLANNCEYVFLLDQPYNKRKNSKLPDNIIRVKTWNEIKYKIKELG